MDLKQGWPALGLVLAVVAIGAWRYRYGLVDRRSAATDLRIAHEERIHRLPRFRFLARRRVRWLIVDVGFAAVALAGALIHVARPVAVADNSREMRSRDVMLCLDVSGSMTIADQAVIASYLKLIGRLDGERIGLVVWDSSSVLAFPLTDDYEFVEAQLRSLLAAFGNQVLGSDDVDGRSVLDAATIGEGSSLIGDGLMSCLLRFDQRDHQRPRTVVFATDNELAGRPSFTLEEAGRRAVDAQVLVFAITPGIEASSQRDELQRVVRSTGGELLDITADPAIETRIIRGIEAQQRRAILAAAGSRSFDLVWPGAVVMTVGVLGMVGSAARGRR